MPIEMPLVMEPQARNRMKSRYDVVSLDRDDTQALHLRFLDRNQVGKRGSREITLEPSVAEALLMMLSRELDSDDEF